MNKTRRKALNELIKLLSNIVNRLKNKSDITTDETLFLVDAKIRLDIAKSFK